jgi:tRNA nucleotidyltransferase/poly(A) polymerase
MVAENPYQALLADPKWGPEIRVLIDLRESREANPFAVGGAVRDLILGRPVKDLDIATTVDGTARALAQAFAAKTGRTLVEYSHRQTIYRVVSAEFPQLDFTDPVGGSRDSDLRRRDFTINAIGLGLVGDHAGKMFDPCNGLEDLRNRTIRMTSPEVFDDDPLRTLRAFRFRSELRFSIEPVTLKEIASRADKIKDVSGERIQLELLGALGPDGSAQMVHEMDSVGLIEPLFPELMTQKGVEQNFYHHLDVWNHTLEVLRQIERIFRFEESFLQQWRERLEDYLDVEYPSGHSRKSLMKLALLLHDIAKPKCRGIREDGRITFIGHETMGSKMAREYLDNLKFPGYEVDFVAQVIAGHLRPALLGQENPDRPRIAYRFFRDYPESAVAMALISLADRLAAQGDFVTEDINEQHRSGVAYLLNCLYEQTDIVVRPPKLIDGSQLMTKLGIQPGPIIGYLLGKVREAQVQGEVKTADEAIEYCRKLAGER